MHQSTMSNFRSCALANSRGYTEEKVSFRACECEKRRTTKNANAKVDGGLREVQDCPAVVQETVGWVKAALCEAEPLLKPWSVLAAIAMSRNTGPLTILYFLFWHMLKCSFFKIWPLIYRFTPFGLLLRYDETCVAVQ